MMTTILIIGKHHFRPITIANDEKYITLKPQIVPALSMIKYESNQSCLKKCDKNM